MKTKMAFITRLISIILSFALLLQPLCCSELFSLSAYQGLTQLEGGLTNLEDNLLKQQQQITLLEGNLKIAEDNLNLANQDLSNAISYSKSLETQLDEASKQLEIVSTSLKNKDITLQFYRITLMVAIPTTFIIGLIAGWKVKELTL